MRELARAACVCSLLLAVSPGRASEAEPARIPEPLVVVQSIAVSPASLEPGDIGTAISALRSACVKWWPGFADGDLGRGSPLGRGHNSEICGVAWRPEAVQWTSMLFGAALGAILFVISSTVLGLALAAFDVSRNALTRAGHGVLRSKTITPMKRGAAEPGEATAPSQLHRAGDGHVA